MLFRSLAEDLLRDGQKLEGLIEADTPGDINLVENGHLPLPANAVQHVVIGVHGGVKALRSQNTRLAYCYLIGIGL